MNFRRISYMISYLRNTTRVFDRSVPKIIRSQPFVGTAFAKAGKQGTHWAKQAPVSKSNSKDWIGWKLVLFAKGQLPCESIVTYCHWGRIYSCFLFKDLAKRFFFCIAVDIVGQDAYL